MIQYTCDKCCAGGILLLYAEKSDTGYEFWLVDEIFTRRITFATTYATI